MSLDELARRPVDEGFPRLRGDEPAAADARTDETLFSPPTRG